MIGAIRLNRYKKKKLSFYDFLNCLSYIKEFVHGDFGRTKPNLTSLLGADCDILELDVQVSATSFSQSPNTS